MHFECHGVAISDGDAVSAHITVLPGFEGCNKEETSCYRWSEAWIAVEHYDDDSQIRSIDNISRFSLKWTRSYIIGETWRGICNLYRGRRF